MISLPFLLLLIALLLAAGLLVVGCFRRSLEWGLLGAALAFWLLALLVGAGIRVG